MPFPVLLEKIPRDAGPAMEVLHMGEGDELVQVDETLAVLSQQDNVVHPALFPGRVDQIPFDAVNQLDPRPRRGIVGFWESLDDTVVRDRHGLMPPLGQQADELAHVDSAVQRAHLGVEVELHPLHLGLVRPSRRWRHPHQSRGIMISSLAYVSTGSPPRSRTQSPTDRLLDRPLRFPTP